jgi:hypothetical protein
MTMPWETGRWCRAAGHTKEYERIKHSAIKTIARYGVCDYHTGSIMGQHTEQLVAEGWIKVAMMFPHIRDSVQMRATLGDNPEAEVLCAIYAMGIEPCLTQHEK